MQNFCKQKQNVCNFSKFSLLIFCIQEPFTDVKNYVFGNGTHVLIDANLTPLAVRLLAPKYGIWYKSKVRVDGVFPYGGPIALKNWYGTEVSIKESRKNILSRNRDSLEGGSIRGCLYHLSL